MDLSNENMIHVKKDDIVLTLGAGTVTNIATGAGLEEIDGFLVGEASTNIDEFLKIIEVVVNQ